jgi:omega-6 fatty acid desaturase (delta-12 desaturase)
MNTIRTNAAIFKLTRPYARASYVSAFWQLGTTLALYAITIWLMFATLDTSYPLTLCLSLVAATAYMRLFMIGHDCSHGSFLPQHWQNEVVGNLMGVLTNTPFDYWAHQHLLHHQGNGNLDKRGDGDVQMMTVEEYRQAPLLAKVGYQIYRNPFFLFGVAAPLHFVALQRYPFGHQSRTFAGWASVLGTNLGIAAYYASMIWIFGLQDFLLVYAPVVALSSAGAVWLFYVQHQYEGTYFKRASEWNYHEAALEGCSFYDLPKILHWGCANIGFHHIHHLNPKVPNYRLPACHRENDVFQEALHLGMKESIGTARLALWDEEADRLIPFAGLRASRELERLPFQSDIQLE